jgi:hypothetical protein
MNVATPMEFALLHPAIGEQTFRLEPGRALVLGREGGDAVDVELNWDPRVSRRHARVVLSDGRVWVEDLGSRNGCWHADVRIEGPVALDPSFTLMVGETVLELRAGGGRERSGARLPPMPPSSLDPPAIVGTADLRDGSMPMPEPRPRPRKLRTPPMFTALDVLELRVDGPEELRDLWNRELSRGGIFVATRSLLPSGTPVTVHVASPHGAMDLRAVVKHSVSADDSARSGMPSGVGLVLLPVSAEERRVIREYAEGMVHRLSATARPEALLTPPPPPIDAATFLALRLQAEAEREDYYAALELAPTVPSHELLARISSLRETLGRAADAAEAEARRTLEAGLEALGRVETALADEPARLVHDFKVGHVRAEERLALAKAKLGPSISALRRAWERAWPEEAERAAMLTRRAFIARQKSEIEAAIEAGRAALEYHPFFDELRPSLRAWQDLLDDERARRKRAP